MALITKPMVPSVVSFKFGKYNNSPQNWCSHVVCYGESLCALSNFSVFQEPGRITFFLFKFFYLLFLFQFGRFSDLTGIEMNVTDKYTLGDKLLIAVRDYVGDLVNKSLRVVTVVVRS